MTPSLDPDSVSLPLTLALSPDLISCPDPVPQLLTEFLGLYPSAPDPN